MQNGNWIPISKAFVIHLPKDRPYTKLEAAYSLQVDYDQGNKVTLTGYANLWRWSKKKVIKFLKDMNVMIVYQENTQFKRNQKGLISILKRDQKETDRRLIRIIDSKWLCENRDQSESNRRLKRDQRGVATKDPYPDPNKDSCPHTAIVNLYHDLLPELPRVKVWSGKRRVALKARWNQGVENSAGIKSNCIEWWDGLFKYIRRSDFLLGKANGQSDRPFRPNLEWICNESNLIKIIEGKYHR